ncbi:MAG TPA: phosphoribosylanthranilate isomerase [Armatimonadetes bacterium]|jgi:phosphoribosylanthranilate isomerase|nr:phosphoribosylanthranilate isomerase [Armatimonadota bacterium]
MRTRVKVCGITRVEDALAAVAAGADALGFVFAPSPRRVTPEKARQIISVLPPLVTPVGVFVNSPAAEVAEVARAAGLRAIQLHGDESPEDARDLRAQTTAWIVRAFRVRGEETLAEIHRHHDCCEAILLDTYMAGAAGGTGRVFDWTLAAQASAFGRPVFLAGGLHPGNVAEAVRQVRPYAVDLSSGIEAAPGVKDPERLRALIAQIREADTRYR